MRIDFAVAFCVTICVTSVTVVFSKPTDDNNDGEYNYYYYSSSSSFGRVNMTELGAYAERFEADMRYEKDTSAVRIRMETLGLRHGPATARGCGYYAQMDGDKNGTTYTIFPAYREHRCEHRGETYLMRTTSLAVPTAYDLQMRFDDRSEKPVNVDVLTNGHRKTHVQTLCVGTYDRQHGHRSVCVNRAMFDECAAQVGESIARYVGTGKYEIPMSQSRSGIHAISFLDLDALLANFRKLIQKESDVAAQSAVCDGIRVMMGTSVDTGYCDAEYTNDVKAYGVNVMPKIRMNPDHCVPIPFGI